ncbi:LisH domain-containing protein ARMC9 [Lamellibrachia satsuma]|nr:LisH domain-containing protein ARMC9 [Lamellibrachia satsuma]
MREILLERRQFEKMSGMVAFEGELNSIVKEFLEFSNFDKTLIVFDEECAEKGKPVAPTDGQPKSDEKLISVQNDMLKQFHLGKSRDFFQLWNDYIPESVRSDDIVAQKLEFYLHIYFAIHPLKKGEKVTHEDVEAGMANFKTYLETQGSSLSQTTEFLPFYALPFVPNPKVHPSYKELFSDKWAPELSDRLDKFLTLALQSVSQSRLFQLFSARGKSIDSLEHKLNESERRAGAYMKRYNRIQGDYHNLIGITADLVDSLEATVQGNPVSPEYLQQICVRLFSNQIRQSLDLTRPGTAAEVLRQSVMPPQGLQQGEAAPNVSLDYEKIKEDLSQGTERTVALLLQALRWKLTKTPPPERDAMMAAYINNDVLGCVRPGAYRKAVLKHLNSDSEFVRQYAARLFNAFASLCDGRSYLAQNPHLMRSLMDNLRADDRDSLTRENVLGCLQKLSLRRALQSMMIEEGIIKWLVSVLEDNDSLSDYTLEYSIALLMNLCLRTAGKRKCTENSQLLLKVLTDLLGHDNHEIIPYVNGTLYSVLAMPSIREEAKAMGMEEILCCFVKEDQPDMNRQIEFIIKQLNSTEEPEESESDDEDDEEDEDDMHPGSGHPGSDNASSDHPGSGHPGSDNASSDHPGSGHPGSDYAGSDHPGSGHPGSDNASSDHPGSDYAGSDHPGSGHPSNGHLAVTTLAVTTLAVATLAVATLAVSTLAVATLAVTTLAVTTLAVTTLAVTTLAVTTLAVTTLAVATLAVTTLAVTTLSGSIERSVW